MTRLTTGSPLLAGVLGVIALLAQPAAKAQDFAPARAGTAPLPPPRHLSATHQHSRQKSLKSKSLKSAAAVPPARPAALPRPAQPPTVGPAPVPNLAVTPPVDNSHQETQVEPSVFQLHYPPQGDGYITGSSPQAMDDRTAAKATGVQVTVPLPQ
jgi:hypothetical protein